MKRWTTLLMGLALAVALGAPLAPARAATSVSINLRIGDPYPGGDLRFEHRPDVVVVPHTRVYYVRNADYDVFRYGKYWYLCDDGIWFRARSVRGPFRHIAFTTVPRAVVYVPEKHWKHWRSHSGRGYARGHQKQRAERREVIVVDKNGKTHKHKSK
jgi:hypothetical protein